MNSRQKVLRRSAGFGNDRAAPERGRRVLIVHATNVHQGGGRSLLLPLLEALEPPAAVSVDERLKPLPKLSNGIVVRTCPPTLMGRLAAEWKLHKTARSGDVILCFGNLPPLFPTPARTIVFVQNRYLLGSESLTFLPWKVRLRLSVERLWLRLCLRDAELVVQTPTMARAVEKATGRCAEICAFAAPLTSRETVPDDASRQKIDFLYVASPEPHKNHRNLLLAWSMLAAEGEAPSLGLTLPPDAPAELRQQVAVLQGQGARIEIIEPCAPADMSALYARAHALIYPSLFESFGLPLLEAKSSELPIVAAERDYVRDVVAPQEAFDPLSPVSIARAVRRFQGRTERPLDVTDPAGFLARLQVKV